MNTAPRFAEHERQLLLRQPGIGTKVIERLEAAGFDSIDALRRSGVDSAVQLVCSSLGSIAWANRRRALGRVVAAIPGQPPAAA